MGSHYMNSAWSALELEPDVFHDAGCTTELSQKMRNSLERIHPYLYTDLIMMMGVGLRSLDYAAKAHGSAHLDFAVHVSREREKLEVLRDRFLEACHEAKTGRDLTAAEKKLMDAVVAIFIALSSTCEYSYDAASHIAALSGSKLSGDLASIRRLSDCSIRSLRLCMVALVNSEAVYALNALRTMETLDDKGSQEDEWGTAQNLHAGQGAWRELAIATYLNKISCHVRVIAARLIDAEIAVTPAQASIQYRRHVDGDRKTFFSSSAQDSRCASMRLGAFTPVRESAPDREVLRNL